MLDEALKHIKETDPPETVQSWIELLSGKQACGSNTRIIYVSNGLELPVEDHSNSDQNTSELTNVQSVFFFLI